MARLAVYTSAAFINAAGIANIAASATVEVRREVDGVLASIFSDEAGTIPITNPSAFADPNGRFQFYAPGLAKGYSVKVTSGVNVWTLHNQAIGTAAQLDAGTVGEVVLGASDQSTARNALGLTNTYLDRLARMRRHFAAVHYV